MKKFKVLSIAVVCTLMLSSVGVMAAEKWKVIISTQKFVVNGQSVKVNALNINDSNYVKVAEMAELLDIAINYDEATNTVAFDKSKPFSGVINEKDSDTGDGKTYINGLGNYASMLPDNDTLYDVQNGDKLIFTLKNIDNGVMTNGEMGSSKNLKLRIEIISPDGIKESEGSVSLDAATIEFKMKGKGQYKVILKNPQNHLINFEVAVKKISNK